MRQFLIALCACASSPAPVSAPHRVVTVYAVPDGAVRRSVEDALAAKLRDQGITATPSYAAGGDFDGVVVLRGDLGESSPNWAMHSSANVDLAVRLETTVYARDGRLLWTARSRTAPGDTIDEVTTVVVRDVVASLR